MKISIVIPTLNEEKYVGNLLDCLVNQTYKDFEVIVSDGNSEDKTRDVVLSYSSELDIKFVEGDRESRGPGSQRNEGSKVALSENLVFFDADVQVEEGFLAKVSNLIDDNKVDLISGRPYPDKSDLVYRVLFTIFYLIIKLLEFVKPGGNGAFLYVKKSVFEELGGFDISLHWQEDGDLCYRAVKLGYRFRILGYFKYITSVRRLEDEGPIKYAKKVFKYGFLSTFKGVKAAQKIKYEFGKYRERFQELVELSGISNNFKNSKPGQTS